ncbi:MAG: hypothetical protein O2985_18955, partial [Proteobacteria bacterium]|nr:hypothetical protein [Pseudomonadota bacterium]
MSVSTEVPLKRRWSILAAKFLFACTIGFAQIWWDPLGLKDGTEELSYNVFSNFYAPLVDPVTRDEIVIVMLREKDMERHGKLWPPPFTAHVETLSRVALAEPAAVYVDFLMVDPRDEESLTYLPWRLIPFGPVFPDVVLGFDDASM